MGQGNAGYNYTVSFDDGGGHATLGVTNIDPSFGYDVVDTTETGQSAEDNTLTLFRTSASGEIIYEDVGTDTPKDDFVTAFIDGTECEFILYPTGNSSGNRTITFNAHITSLTLPNNGPGGVVRSSFTIQLSDGTKPTFGTV